MKAFDHLKINQLIKENGLYRRFLQFVDSNGNYATITKGEFESFEKEYMNKHKIMTGVFDRYRNSNKFKTN